MQQATAQPFARAWIEAWNRHDLDAILAHYADEVEFTSPFIVSIMGIPDGTLRGRVALREYFAKALQAYPDLHFTLHQALAGVNSLTLCYESVPRLSAVETMLFDSANKIARVLAHYTAAAPLQPVHEWARGDYLLTDDQTRMNFERIEELLRRSYWAKDRPRAVMRKAMEHSVCLGLLRAGELVGFARGVTDHATFTWVCDVIIHPDHRGHGLGKWMMECFLAHPRLQTVSYLLRTKDAHGLYGPFGFERVESMRRSRNPA